MTKKILKSLKAKKNLSKKSKPKKGKFSLEFLEGNIIKITCIVLTILVAVQIILIKGHSLVKELQGDVLDSDSHEVSHESSKTINTENNNYSCNKNENFIGQSFENVNNIVLKWSSEGDITYANKFALIFFGYNEKELLCNSIFMTVPGVESDTQRDLNILIRKVLHNPEEFKNIKHEIIKKDGTRTWVNWALTVFYNDDGTFEILSIGNEMKEEEVDKFSMAFNRPLGSARP
jgi:PAS domain S-box-containing protein